MLIWKNGRYIEDNRKNITIYEMANRNKYVREVYMNEDSEPELTDTYMVLKTVFTMKR